MDINFKRPLFLEKGDTIIIVAPSGVVREPAAIHKAKNMLDDWGFEVLLGPNTFNNNYHFAGTDQERAADMQWALDHPTAKAIWCAKGGYGSVRIIDRLDFTKFLQKPKWLIGYSDFTVFHSHVHNLKVQTLHAPMPVNFRNEWMSIETSINSLKETIMGELPKYRFKYSKYNQLGTIKGLLVGGNLTLLENLIGTASDIDTTNKIIFIEEIGEYKYHLDRLLRALDRSGHFKKCAGLILGDFSDIKANEPAYGKIVEEIVTEISNQYQFPVAFNFPAGHELLNLPLIFGAKATLKVTENYSQLTFE